MCYILCVIFAAPRRRCFDPCADRRGVDPPRKPLPRKKIPTDLKSLARGHTALCTGGAGGIVSQEAIPPAARVSAAGILLDRGWGKAAQTHTDADDGPIRIVIRQFSDVCAEAQPLLIEQDDGCDEA